MTLSQSVKTRNIVCPQGRLPLLAERQCTPPASGAPLRDIDIFELLEQSPLELFQVFDCLVWRLPYPQPPRQPVMLLLGAATGRLVRAGPSGAFSPITYQRKGCEMPRSSTSRARILWRTNEEMACPWLACVETTSEAAALSSAHRRLDPFGSSPVRDNY